MHRLLPVFVAAIFLSLAACDGPGSDGPKFSGADQGPGFGLDVDGGAEDTSGDASDLEDAVEADAPTGDAEPDLADLPDEGEADAPEGEADAPDAEDAEDIEDVGDIEDAMDAEDGDVGPLLPALEVIPSDLVDFGVVAQSTTATRTVTLRNVGDAPLDVTGVSVAAASGSGGAGKFSVAGPSAFSVAADAKRDLIVSFANQGGASGTSLGTLTILSDDPEQPEWTVTLTAERKADAAPLSPLPGALDLGEVAVGCAGASVHLDVCNPAVSPVAITSATLAGCSDAVEVVDAPPLPQDVPSAGCVRWTFRYVPDGAGSDSCAFEVYVGDAEAPSAVVPVSGDTASAEHHVEEWTQSGAGLVDALFVVDSSGSMIEEQIALGDGFSEFVDAVSAWEGDFHAAVTSMDPAYDEGRLLGDPRIIDETTWEHFADNAQVGTWGSGIEAGLRAAELALTLPNIAESGTTCDYDGDCGPPMGCYDSVCGGANHGFLRSGAALEIVFLSDEDDQSEGSVDYYESVFRSIKGFDHPELLRVHAIVGPVGGCSAVTGTAEEGERYLDLVARTGGISGSICESDLGDALGAIGHAAFGPGTTFALSNPPEPSTLAVSVDGAACPSAGGESWSWDAGAGAVRFELDGACMPGIGQAIRIEYDAACLAP